MAGTLQKVRFKLAWQGYRVGDEIVPNGTLRDWLVANGYVDIVEAGGKSPADRQIKRHQKRESGALI